MFFAIPTDTSVVGSCRCLHFIGSIFRFDLGDAMRRFLTEFSRVTGDQSFLNGGDDPVKFLQAFARLFNYSPLTMSQVDQIPTLNLPTVSKQLLCKFFSLVDERSFI